jgi:hypothetical protein
MPGIASAQAPQSAGAPMMMAPSQGMVALPWAQGPTTNNNNNSYGVPSTYNGDAAFSKNAVPTPGTVVIRLNGKVEVDMDAFWTTGNTVQTTDGKVYKINPVSFASRARLYPGVDGMATNGLRYGAAIELRQNFESGNSYAFTGNASATAPGAGFTPGGNTIGTSAASPSGNSSAQTVFVRRAFTYLASDNFGIVRFGAGDGIISLFDPGIFSGQGWDAGAGNFNGDVIQSQAPGAGVNIPFAWLAQSGAEYTNVKIVYLSPQFFGLDVGLQYAPSMGNGYSNGVTASPLQATTCNAAGAIQSATQSTSGCIGTTSGNDATRWYNQVAVGARWQGSFGPVDLGAYAVYETAGKEQFSGAANTLGPNGAYAVGAATGAFRYDNLSFVSAAAYSTFHTGVGSFTLSFDYIGGALNGQLAMRPTGGVPEEAFLPAIVYRNGGLSLGAQVGLVNSQGAAQLTKVSQRREFEVAFGGSYNLAPGLYLVGEYQYFYRHQGGFDFNGNCVSGSSGCLTSHAGSSRDGRGQGIQFSTVVNW